MNVFKKMFPRSAPKPLLGLSLPQAAEIKWRAGQKRYGKKFVGHPVEQLSEELADAYNYVEEAERWGYDTLDLRNRLLVMWSLMHEVHESKNTIPKGAAKAVSAS